jgi:hypothetical protein
MKGKCNNNVVVFFLELTAATTCPLTNGINGTVRQHPVRVDG